MNTYLIYKITCLVTNKVYIGQVVAKPIAERFERHIKTAFDDNNDFSKRCHLYRAMRKYGADKFIVEQIDSADNQEELNQKEKYWIKKYNSISEGYNCADGGEGGNTYAGISAERLDEIKAKISKSNSGRNNGQSKQIKCKSVKTLEEHYFETLTACLQFFNIKNKGVVMDRVNGKITSLWRHEWQFAFEDADYMDFQDIYYDPSCRKGIKVRLEKNGEVFNFNSIRKAAEFLKVNRRAIINNSIINGYKIIC